MKALGSHEIKYPETQEELETWEPSTVRHALAMKVLAVARTRVEGTWAAYVDAVPGMRHEFEEGEVLRNGSKLPENVALLLFPMFDGVPYAC